MRPCSPQEKFCECKKSLSSVAFDEPVKVPRISQPLSVWPFSMLLYWYVWTHPRSLSLNDSQEQKTLLSCPLFSSLFISTLLFHFCFIQTGIGQGTSNLFLRQAAPQWVLAGLKGFMPSLRLFQHPLPFGWGRKDVSSRAEAYSFVGCRRLTHCRSFGNKSSWLYSLGPGCFFHQCAKDMSRKFFNPPVFLFWLAKITWYSPI